MIFNADKKVFLFFFFFHYTYAGKVGVPRQLVIKKDASSISDAVAKYGLTLPLGMHMSVILESHCLGHSVGGLLAMCRILLATASKIL